MYTHMYMYMHVQIVHVHVHVHKLPDITSSIAPPGQNSMNIYREIGQLVDLDIPFSIFSYLFQIYPELFVKEESFMKANNVGVFTFR